MSASQHTAFAMVLLVLLRLLVLLVLVVSVCSVVGTSSFREGVCYGAMAVRSTNQGSPASFAHAKKGVLARGEKDTGAGVGLPRLP